MSCLACSLPCLVGLLGLFNSPYPSRTPELSQWSDRPRRVGLGPQFLSRGSLMVRDSVVGRRWGFILCGCLSSTWCAHWDGILLTECRGGHCAFVARPTQCMPLYLLQGRVPHGVLIACASLLLRPLNYYFKAECRKGRVPHGVLIPCAWEAGCVSCVELPHLRNQRCPSSRVVACWKLQPDRGIDTASHAKHGVDFPHRWPGARAGILPSGQPLCGVEEMTAGRMG